MAPSIVEIDKEHFTVMNGIGKSINGNVQNNSNTSPYIAERPYGTKKKLRVAMIGAGISGLNFFKVAEEKLENIDIICYEKNKDIGGTQVYVIYTK